MAARTGPLQHCKDPSLGSQSVPTGAQLRVSSCLLSHPIPRTASLFWSGDGNMPKLCYQLFLPQRGVLPVVPIHWTGACHWLALAWTHRQHHSHLTSANTASSFPLHLYLARSQTLHYTASEIMSHDIGDDTVASVYGSESSVVQQDGFLKLWNGGTPEYSSISSLVDEIPFEELLQTHFVGADLPADTKRGNHQVNFGFASGQKDTSQCSSKLRCCCDSNAQ